MLELKLSSYSMAMEMRVTDFTGINTSRNSGGCCCVICCIFFNSAADFFIVLVFICLSEVCAGLRFVSGRSEERRVG